MNIGRLKTIVFLVLLAIPVILCISIFPILLLFVILYPLFRMLWNMSDGIVQVFGMEVVPPERRGVANSSYQIALQVTMGIAAPIGGILINRLGYTHVFWITVAVFSSFPLLMWGRFAGKRFVPPANPDATEIGQEEEERASTSGDDSLVTDEGSVN